MPIRGKISFPGDKSISHRTLMLAGLTKGKSIIHNLGSGQDVSSTRDCLEACGLNISGNNLTVVNGGPLKKPFKNLNCGNSGTSARLLLGLLAGQGIKAGFYGDQSLSSRPMARILDPLKLMGLKVSAQADKLPINVSPPGPNIKLNGINYTLPLPSAQVKSALLLAALGADSTTTLIEPVPTRNHTELLLKQLGAEIQINGHNISLGPLQKTLTDFEIHIPGDPSTAAFFAAAAVLLDDSEIILNNILRNPTRLGFFKQLEKMGVEIDWLDIWQAGPEGAGNLKIKTSPLNAFQINKNEIPQIIDEIPILAILATQAQGTSIITGAQELRLKESDRIHGICTNLTNMGAHVEELDDGFIIKGPTPLKAAAVETFGDHRLAMAFTVAGLLCSETVKLDNSACVDISYPEFFSTLEEILK